MGCTSSKQEDDRDTAGGELGGTLTDAADEVRTHCGDHRPSPILRGTEIVRSTNWQSSGS